jgi:hypothetical protein
MSRWYVTITVLRGLYYVAFNCQWGTFFEIYDTEEEAYRTAALLTQRGTSLLQYYQYLDNDIRPFRVPQ